MSTDAPPTANTVPAYLQARVHAMIADLGGYWRPVNAVARLLEELAELGEELTLANAGDNRDRLSGEFADLWIISTCLASQFTVTLADDPDPATANHADKDKDKHNEANGFARLVEDAGRIARVVNYYDGPKNPRSLDGFPTLTAAIGTFQRTLRMLAASHGVDLHAAVESKVAAAGQRDRGRFAVSYDPSTADSLRAFRAAVTPSSETARSWGAPAWDRRLTVEHNVDRIVPFLTSFAKAAEREALTGFVIRLDDGPETAGLPALSRHLSRVLTCLAARSPQPNGAFRPEVRRPGWQFSFHGARLLITVFTPLHPAPLRHHSEHGTFVLLEPEARPKPT
ncbi:MAG TPA: hypothetical protein VIL16_12625 [Trebonia sp.]